MINALFSSKIGGSKQFQRTDKCTFGWEAIDSLYQRELERAKQNLARMVPRLKRDSRPAGCMDKTECSSSKDHAGKV